MNTDFEDKNSQILTDVIQTSKDVHGITPEIQSDTGDNPISVLGKEVLVDKPQETVSDSKILCEDQAVKGTTTFVAPDSLLKLSPSKSQPQCQNVQVGHAEDEKKRDEKKKDDEKLAIYKALAIKLKKELVKCREELQKLSDEKDKESCVLNDKINLLEHDLESERHANITSKTTLEATVKNLRLQIQRSESELQSVQNEFENYKIQASKIMSQSGQGYSSSNKTFAEERYKQLKELNDDQVRRITNLEAQLGVTLVRSRELEKEVRLLQEQLKQSHEKAEFVKGLEYKYEKLARENENLKLALGQFRSKLKEPTTRDDILRIDSEDKFPGHDQVESNVISDSEIKKESYKDTKLSHVNIGQDQTDQLGSLPLDERLDENAIRSSPTTSVKEDSQTNSSSSFDGSTSGYVHIKPTTFEIISRSSVLEDAQNQMDNLTKAYLDSENTNSLLSEQVKALKDEIRRLQRRAERLELAENLEYLKNVVFKFISLDSNQAQQKQRLVPVLSTVLKLSPSETAKLNSLAVEDKSSITSSFFKL